MEGNCQSHGPAEVQGYPTTRAKQWPGPAYEHAQHVTIPIKAHAQTRPCPLSRPCPAEPIWAGLAMGWDDHVLGWLCSVQAGLAMARTVHGLRWTWLSSSRRVFAMVWVAMSWAARLLTRLRTGHDLCWPLALLDI
jgi:hypothetical protein